jgi:hypothetical protein
MFGGACLASPLWIRTRVRDALTELRINARHRGPEVSVYPTDYFTWQLRTTVVVRCWPLSNP